ncbi:MAG: twin-arginine translocase subunit TatC, partial [Pseudomonadota bacterium]|nr:twin-arginine translocase subunit TatC [Pseudomonadota bacterium]
PKGGQMIAIDVITPFFVPLKVAMMAAFIIALPYILYQAWLFVAPGMHKHEKRLMLPLVMASVVLCFFGMAFAYFVVFPVVFGFFSGAAPQGVAVMTDIDKYLSFVMGMFLAFGTTFEVPVAVVVLVKMDVVNIAKLKEIRPYVIVGAFILGALLTPPDVVSQFMLAIPLWLLYEVGIVVAGWMTKDSTEVETKNG